MFTKALHPLKQMDKNLTENLLRHVKKKMFRKKCLKYDILKRKDLPKWNCMLLWFSPLCLGMGECFLLFAAFQRASCCHSTLKIHPSFLTVVPTYWEFRTVYICRCFRFTIFMTFKICILCINEQNVYKTFQGKTISGGDNKSWYLIRISEKIILIDIKDKLVEGKRTGLKTQRCSMFEFESYSDLIFFFLLVSGLVGRFMFFLCCEGFKFVYTFWNI